MDLLYDIDEEVCEVVVLKSRELCTAAKPEAVREKTVHNMEVRTTDLGEDRGVVREEGKDRTTQVAIEKSTESALFRALG